MCAGIGKKIKSKTKFVLEILPISREGGGVELTPPCSGNGCSNTCSVDGIINLNINAGDIHLIRPFSAAGSI